MPRRELEYVDLRDPSARQRFFVDAPTPLQGLLLPDVHAVDSPTVLPPPKRAKTPRPPQESRMKRRYVKTTLDQKLGLTAEFERVGDALSDVEYSTKFGIPLKTHRNY